MFQRRIIPAALFMVSVFIPFIPQAQHYLPRSSSPFRLPIAPGLTVLVYQGNNSPYDHRGKQAWAFDFTVGKTNFVVTAAQGGKVIEANDSSNIQCSDVNTEIAPVYKPLPDCWTSANHVLIVDDDGMTATLYMHLLFHSLKVSPNMHINQGDPLGLAGTTGWSSGVHLHFQVEDIPQKTQSSGWWWTQSRPVSFANQEVLALDPNGVPQVDQTVVVSNAPQQTSVPQTAVSQTPISSPVKPGGMWTDPSPTEGQGVSDVIHFAAHAFPTHSGDPVIAHVNFTVKSQGSWKVACTAFPPATGDVFSCDANLKNLGISYGQIQASFDVYDQAGNINLAPNGVHTLTYAPSPGATPVTPTSISPTPIPPTPVTPTSIPPTPIPPTPVTPTPIPPTPTPVVLSSGTWQDPYGGASYVGDSVTLQLVVQGSTLSGTMTGDLTGKSTAVQGQDGLLSSFNSTDQQFLNFVIQNYGMGTGIFLVYTNSSDFEGATAGSRFYLVLQQDGSLSGFWYFPNGQHDAGALTFNKKS